MTFTMGSASKRSLSSRAHRSDGIARHDPPRVAEQLGERAVAGARLQHVLPEVRLDERVDPSGVLVGTVEGVERVDQLAISLVERQR